MSKKRRSDDSFYDKDFRVSFGWYQNQELGEGKNDPISKVEISGNKHYKNNSSEDMGGNDEDMRDSDEYMSDSVEDMSDSDEDLVDSGDDLNSNSGQGLGYFDYNNYRKSNEKIHNQSMLSVQLFSLLFLFIMQKFSLNKRHCDVLYKFILMLMPSENNCPKSFYLLLKHVIDHKPAKVNQNCKKCEEKKDGK